MYSKALQRLTPSRHTSKKSPATGFMHFTSQKCAMQAVPCIKSVSPRVGCEAVTRSFKRHNVLECAVRRLGIAVALKAMSSRIEVNRAVALSTERAHSEKLTVRHKMARV